MVQMLAAVAAISAMAAPTQACPGARQRLDRTATEAYEQAVICLANRERAGRGLTPLRSEPELVRAGRGHARDMVRRHYFAHVSPTGAGVGDRLRAVGWLPRRGAASYGEVIADGTGPLSTPRAIVAAWMASPPHRAALLAPRFREIGAGAAAGTPSSSDGATVTVDLGARQPA